MYLRGATSCLFVCSVFKDTGLKQERGTGARALQGERERGSNVRGTGHRDGDGTDVPAPTQGAKQKAKNSTKGGTKQTPTPSKKNDFRIAGRIAKPLYSPNTTTI